MLIDDAHPWTCPLADCRYKGKSVGGRAAHLRMKHGITPAPASDEQLTGLEREPELPGFAHSPVAEAAQDQDVAARLTKIETAVQQLVDREPAKPAAAAAEYPTLAQVLEHCESGSCAAHAKELEELKATVVQAAYDNMPEDLVRQKAEQHNLIPTSIQIVPA